MFCTFDKCLEALDEKLALMDIGIKNLQTEVNEAKAEARELRKVVSDLKKKKEQGK